MEKDAVNQLLTVLSIIQQDMHELKFTIMNRIMNYTNSNNKQLRDIQVKLMLVEAILKKHFGNDFIDELDIIEKSNLL